MCIKSCCEAMFMERATSGQNEGKMQVSRKKCAAVALGASSIGLAAVAALMAFDVISGSVGAFGVCAGLSVVAAVLAAVAMCRSKKSPEGSPDVQVPADNDMSGFFEGWDQS